MTYSVMWVLLWRKGLGTGFSHSQNCWLVPKVKRLTTYVLMPDGSQFSLSGCTLQQANEELYVFLCHFVHKLGAQVTHYCVSAQNEHVAPGAQSKHKQSTHQAQDSCSSNGRTQAHHSLLRGVCALLHSLKHGIWHSCILVFCFLNSFLTILYWAHMMYVYSPFRHHPPPSRQVQKYISWVGGGAPDQIRRFNNAKRS